MLFVVFIALVGGLFIGLVAASFAMMILEPHVPAHAYGPNNRRPYEPIVGYTVSLLVALGGTLVGGMLIAFLIT